MTLLALALTLAGCDPGDGLDRRAVSGTVTLDGRPLAAGSILLEPAPGSASGTAVGASIEAGRFDVPRARGPTPGRYLVRIYSSSGLQADPEAGQSPKAPRPMIEAVPGRYNAQTELEAEVTDDGPNAYRFPLTTDAP